MHTFDQTLSRRIDEVEESLKRHECAHQPIFDRHPYFIRGGTVCGNGGAIL